MQVEDLLQQCTVKLSIPGQPGWGTGFFVATGWILTCAHVVKALVAPNRVRVQWQQQVNFGEAELIRQVPELDLALLEFTTGEADLPCVYLDEAVQPGQDLYFFGYPDADFDHGCPVMGSCEGLTGDLSPLIKFKQAQVRPGMSGSALLNRQTGKVCGMVKFTRDRSSDLGGGAIPTRVILEQFPELRELQQQFHESDRRWSSLLAQPSNTAHGSQFESLPSVMAQTQTGANSKNFIGGEHHHHAESSEVKRAVKKTLMLSANPKNTKSSARKKEITTVKDALDRATIARAKQGKHSIIFESPLDGLKVRASDFSREIATIQPSIICISGNENGIESLILEESSDNTTPVNTKEIIARSFKLHANSIECIILNRCYSEEQAREIVQYIPFVIGINQSLKDNQISSFLADFYFFLGLGKTTEDAYHAGYNRLERSLFDDSLMPILLKKDDEIKRRLLEERLNACSQELKKEQNNVEFWQKKAGLLTELGRSKEANEAYEKASSLDSDNYRIRTEQGDALEQLGEPEKAVAAYHEALVLEDKDYKVWWKKGRALVKLEKYDEAIEAYRRALELEPPSPDSYIICREYADLSAKLGHHQKAVSLYKKSLSFEPNYRASSYERKQLYKKMYSRKV